MSLYRKKPIVIEAFHILDLDIDEYEDDDIPEWFIDAVRTGIAYFEPPRTPGEDSRLYIRTIEGIHEAKSGDYIIQGVQGELYPCKQDIFEATYEKV